MEELLKEAKNFLIITDKDCGIKGNSAEILTLYIILTQELNKIIDKEILEDAFKRAFYKPEELLEELKYILEKLNKSFEKENN